MQTTIAIEATELQKTSGSQFCAPKVKLKKVEKRLGKLLDGLSAISDFEIEEGELTKMLGQFKSELHRRLRQDGWSIDIPHRRHVVRKRK